MSQLVRPYVTTAEFRSSPTWLDTESLVPGGDTVRQDAELGNTLLKASAWATGVCNQRLDAHAVLERMRVTPDRNGRISIHAAVRPVRKVTALSYGEPGNLTAVSDLSGVWVEDDVQIIASLGGVAGFGPALEFGPPRGQVETFVQLGYVAAYTSTVLAAPALLGASSITVADPTGVYPGDVLRIWEPGKEEAVTVAAGYVTGATAVPLTAGLVNAHALGSGISMMPPDAQQAVTNYTVALLMRPDTQAEDQFPDGAPSTGTRGRDARKTAGGLIAEACRLLRSYGRVR